jgi:hypothetical protein
MTKNLKKFTAKKIQFFLDQLIPRFPERTSKLQKKPSALKREYSALQNMKFLNFFLLLWVIFALLDLDSESGSGYGCTDLIQSGSNSDLDPKLGPFFASICYWFSGSDPVYILA